MPEIIGWYKGLRWWWQTLIVLAIVLLILLIAGFIPLPGGTYTGPSQPG